MSIAHVAKTLRLLARELELGHVPATMIRIEGGHDGESHIHVILDFKKNEDHLKKFVMKLMVSGMARPG